MQGVLLFLSAQVAVYSGLAAHCLRHLFRNLMKSSSISNMKIILQDYSVRNFDKQVTCCCHHNLHLTANTGNDCVCSNPKYRLAEERIDCVDA